MDDSILSEVATTMGDIEASIVDVVLDGDAYRPGRAIAVDV